MSELSNQETFSSFGNIIKEDDSTADFSIRCETRECRVHKVVLCARSSVFRAMILTDMLEASKGEIFIENLRGPLSSSSTSSTPGSWSWGMTRTSRTSPRPGPCISLMASWTS